MTLTKEQKEKIIAKVANDICIGVNKGRKREGDIHKLEVDMLANFGVLGLDTPLNISEAFYNSFLKIICKECGREL